MQEIAKIESGEWPADDNPLKNAPHTQKEVGAGHDRSRSLCSEHVPDF